MAGSWEGVCGIYGRGECLSTDYHTIHHIERRSLSLIDDRSLTHNSKILPLYYSIIYFRLFS